MLIKVVAADNLPVSLAEACEHCRAPENGDDDALVRRALEAAVEYVERKCHIVLAPTTFEYRLPTWPWCAKARAVARWGYFIDVPGVPVRDIISIEYTDENEAEQTIAEAGNWTWTRTSQGARIRFNSAFSLPRLTEESDNAVRITLESGFDDPTLSGSGDDPSLVLPNTVPIAVLLLTEHWYEHRGIVEMAQSYRLVASADAILARLQVYH